MTILGIGVDVVHVPRIAQLLRRRGPDKFASRILSAFEHAQWKCCFVPQADLYHPRCVQFLAVRWCVKEAAYKAFYPVVKTTWKELTYHPVSKDRKPFLEYCPLNEEKARKVGDIHMSISHDGEYIYSSVLAQEPGTRG